MKVQYLFFSWLFIIIVCLIMKAKLIIELMPVFLVITLAVLSWNIYKHYAKENIKKEEGNKNEC